MTHDLDDLRRGLRQIADTAPGLDIDEVLARSTVDGSAEGDDDVSRRRSRRAARRVSPWAAGVAAAAALAAIVAPAALHRDVPAIAEAPAIATVDAGSTAAPALVGDAATAADAAGTATSPPAAPRGGATPAAPAPTGTVPPAGPAPYSGVGPTGAVPSPGGPTTLPPAWPGERPTVAPAVPVPVFPPDTRATTVPAPAPIPLPTWDPGRSGAEALLVGRPRVATGGCVVVDDARGRSWPMVWPTGFRAVRQGADVTILDGHGTRVGTIGAGGRPGSTLRFTGATTGGRAAGWCGTAANSEGFAARIVEPAG